jgi:hypothetical protein
MIAVIRLEHPLEKCPKCGQDLEPKNWAYSPFDYIKKKWCEKCEILYEYEIPKPDTSPVFNSINIP